MEQFIQLLSENFPLILLVVVGGLFLLFRGKSGLSIDLKNQKFELGGKQMNLASLLKGMLHVGEIRGRTKEEKVKAQKSRVDQMKQAFISTLTMGGDFQPNPFVLACLWKDWQIHLYSVADLNRIEEKFVTELEIDPTYVSLNITSMLNVLQQYRREFPGSIPDNEHIEEPLKIQFQALIRAMRDIGREKDKEMESDTQIYKELLDEISGEKSNDNNS